MNWIPFISNCFVRKNNEEEKSPSIQPNKNIIQEKIKRRLDEAEINSSGIEGTQIYPKVHRKYRSLMASRISSLDDAARLNALKIDSTDDSVNGDGIDIIDDLKVKILTAGEWLKILNNSQVNEISTTELIQSLRHGIPDELRPAIWEYLTRIDTLKAQYSSDYYETLKNKPSPSDGQINKDIGRTFPTSQYFQNEEYNAETLLANILRAYANHDKEIGYIQGMNFIVGKILIILNPDNYIGSELKDMRDSLSKILKKINLIRKII